jgi:hypothetical protein
MKAGFKTEACFFNLLNSLNVLGFQPSTFYLRISKRA